MPTKSLINTAYDVLTKKYADEGAAFTPIPFSDLLMAVGGELGIQDEDTLKKIASRFYTDLTLDGRFVIKENNTWSLREHELFANVHIDMNDVYSEEDIDSTRKEDKDDDDDDNDEEDSAIYDEKEEELGEETGEDKVYSSDEDD